MARWVWPAAAGLVTSGVGVAINLATDGNAWAWGVVVLFTAAGVVVTQRLQPPQPAIAPAPAPAAAQPPAQAPAPEPAAEPEPEPEPPPRAVYNTYSGGSANGPVIQVGYVGSPGAIKVNSPTSVNQHAVAREGGTVHQAGRDIKPNP